MLGQMFCRDVASPILLNHSTQPLPHLMSRRLDLIIMRSPSPLLQLLQTTGNFRSPLQKFCQLRLHRHLFRVHANLLVPTPTYHTASSLTHFQTFPLLTFPEGNLRRNP